MEKMTKLFTIIEKKKYIYWTRLKPIKGNQKPCIEDM